MNFSISSGCFFFLLLTRADSGLANKALVVINALDTEKLTFCFNSQLIK